MTVKFKMFLVISMGIFWLGCKQRETATAAEPVTSSPTPPAKETTITVNLDKSPLDISYYPVDYPKLIMTGNTREPLVARVIYIRPRKDGRVIFGKVLRYGSRWRLGANEATEIEFFRDVIIQQKRIKKNRYILYSIPFENKWTIILNNDLFTWGLKIDSTKDVYRFDVSVSKSQYPMEYFTIGFEKADSGIYLVMAWDTVKTMLPIRY